MSPTVECSNIDVTRDGKSLYQEFRQKQFKSAKGYNKFEGKIKTSHELDLEKCTFTPKLITKNNSKPRLYDWMSKNKNTISSANQSYNMRIKHAISINKSASRDKIAMSKPAPKSENEFITKELNNMKSHVPSSERNVGNTHV